MFVKRGTFSPTKNAPPLSTVLETKGLSKNYGKLRAVDHLSLTVEEGSIFGILGPNGSGKTTTLGMVLGVLNPTEGDFSWFGQKADAEVRKQIGAVHETPNFYPYLSGENNLRIVCKIKGVPYSRVDEVLKMTGLLERKRSKFKTYSLGMKQRLAIAATLLADTRALVLDEPTNGLDPQGIAEIRELIIQIAHSGKTIILASHLLDEVEKVCTHVAVLKKGKLLASGPVGNVLADEDRLEVAAADMPKLEAALQSYQGVSNIEKVPRGFLVAFDGATDAAQLNRYLAGQGIYVSLLNTKKKTLESQFMELIGKDA